MLYLLNLLSSLLQLSTNFYNFWIWFPSTYPKFIISTAILFFLNLLAKLIKAASDSSIGLFFFVMQNI